MPFEEVTGDLFTLGLDAIGHGCNCQGVMGAGIAAEFRRRYPRMFRTYRDKCHAGQFMLGDFYAYIPAMSPPRMIYNLATQLTPGPVSSFSITATGRLDAIGSSVHDALEHARGYGLPSLGLPRVGCGLGGLDWPDVRKILAEAGEASPVRLVAVTLPAAHGTNPVP